MLIVNGHDYWPDITIIKLANDNTAIHGIQHSRATPSPNSRSQVFFLYVCPESSLIVLTLTKQSNVSFINICFALRIATSSYIVL